MIQKKEKKERKKEKPIWLFVLWLYTSTDIYKTTWSMNLQHKSSSCSKDVDTKV